MDDRDALIPVLVGPLSDVKEVAALCADAGMEVAVTREACAKPSCSPKFHLLARQGDAARIQGILRERWTEALEADGLAPVALEAPGDGELPCPACGTAEPLVDGACSDCGLQLE